MALRESHSLLKLNNPYHHCLHFCQHSYLSNSHQNITLSSVKSTVCVCGFSSKCFHNFFPNNMILSAGATLHLSQDKFLFYIVFVVMITTNSKVERKKIYFNFHFQQSISERNQSENWRQELETETMKEYHYWFTHQLMLSYLFIQVRSPCLGMDAHSWLSLPTSIISQDNFAHTVTGQSPLGKSSVAISSVTFKTIACYFKLSMLPILFILTLVCFKIDILS